MYGSSRSRLVRAKVRRLGGHPVTPDATDADAVRDALGRATDVVVNMLTDLKSPPSFRDDLDGTMVATNHLRTAVTDSWLAAAVDVGGGGTSPSRSPAGSASPLRAAAQVEAAELLADPPPSATKTVGALRHLESTVTAAPAAWSSVSAPSTASERASERMVRRWRT